MIFMGILKMDTKNGGCCLTMFPNNGMFFLEIRHPNQGVQTGQFVRIFQFCKNRDCCDTCYQIFSEDYLFCYVYITMQVGYNGEEKYGR